MNAGLLLAVGVFGLAAFLSFARWRQSAAIVRHARGELLRLVERNVMLRRHVARLSRAQAKAFRANARLTAEMARKDQMLVAAWQEIRELRETVHTLTAVAVANDQNAADWLVWNRNTDESLDEDARAQLDAQFSGLVSTFELAQEMGDES